MAQVHLQSLDGRLLQSHTFSNVAELESYRFDVSDLPSGLYVMQLIVGEAVGVTKVVVER